MINPFVYFTPIDWAVTIFAVVMLTLLIILWFLSVWKRKKHVYDAFGYVWRINSLANIQTKLNRLFLLPTISVVRNESLYAGHNIRYWSFDFMWLRKIYVLEVEQLNKKKYE